MNIKCKQCGETSDWEVVAIHDNPNTNYAYNLSQCSCGTLLKEDVWDNKGLTWILENGEVVNDSI